MNVGSQHRLQFTNMVKSQFVEVCFALDRRRRHVGREPKAFLVTRIFNPQAHTRLLSQYDET